MKAIRNSIFGLALAIVLMAYGCSPDKYELGTLLTKDDLKFTVIQDANDPNTVILESLTPNAIPSWVTSVGRSTKVRDTVKIAFAGEYTITYGAMNAGGYVEADPFILHITTDNLSYVDSELWTLLSGGVGNEKTWYLDLDENGISRYFAGPLSFFGTDDSWHTVTEGQTIDGDSWNWQPDWAGNQWLMDAADFGSMTFNLINGANVRVEHKTIPARGTQVGTYMLDENVYTLRLNGAGILHDSNRDGVVINWGDTRLLSLTENSMQLAVYRDPVLSGEGPALLVYNFISKDYFDNWVPPAEQP